MEIISWILILILGFTTIKYKMESDNNKKPYVDISLNEMLQAAREQERDMDKLGLNIAQINQTVDISKIDDTGLVIYRHWLYEQFRQVKQVIKKRN